MTMDVRTLLEEIGGEGSVPAGTLSKIASDGASEPMEKLAAEGIALGEIIGDALVGRVLDRLEKLAMDRASSSHPSAGGVTEPSKWSGIAQKLQGIHGNGKAITDEGHTRAEKVINNLGRGLTSGRES